MTDTKGKRPYELTELQVAGSVDGGRLDRRKGPTARKDMD